MNVYIVASPGGHLTQALSFAEAFTDCHVSLITLDFPNLRGIALEGVDEIHRMRLLFKYSMRLGVPATLLASFVFAFRLFLRRRPHLLFSTGSEIAIPPFLVGKYLFGARTVYLESLTRINDLSLTGRILYRMADLFLVQWKELVEKYPRALFRGSLI